METAEAILAFWFGADSDDARTAEQKKQLWWAKDSTVDHEISVRFSASTAAAAQGALDEWRAGPRGLLALILLTDQFPRNMYRGLPASFSFDVQALRWCKQALEQGDDRRLRPIERVFLYLPLEHSESLADQERAVELFKQLCNEVPADQQLLFAGFRDFAIRHRDIIARFGRFPHRNAILGRTSTADEQAFLQTAGSSF